jgi:hypothetical protein
LVVQLVGQATLEPSQANGVQAGEPAVPAVVVRQVPSLPGSLQRSHAPAHSASQQ